MNTPKEVEGLNVYRGATHLGQLTRTQKGCQFVFSQDFLLADSGYQELCFNMPKSKASYQQDGINLFPFFAGLLPEGLRFDALALGLKTSKDDLFTILAAVGNKCVGDVYTEFADQEQNTISAPKLSEINFYDFFYDSISPNSVNRQAEGLAGVQEKLSASMISFPVNIAKKNKSYILKLNPKDKPNLIHNEFKSLQLAARCGLRVNTAKIIKDKDKNVGLLVERFDRIATEDGKTIMVHQEDACQFLNHFPADKYRVSMRQIAEGIQRLSTAPLVDNLRLLQLKAFSYIIGNGDLHAKNISLQVDPKNGRVQLTPFYDLICTYIYKDRKMALKMEGRDDNLKREDFVRFAERQGLNRKATEGMLDTLLKKMGRHKKILLSIDGLSEKDKTLVEKMLKKRMKDLT